MTARLFTLDPLEGFRPKTFAGHRDAVLGGFFAADGKHVSLDVCQAGDLTLIPRLRRSIRLAGMARYLFGRLNRQKMVTGGQMKKMRA